MAGTEPLAINVTVDASALRRELTEAERMTRSFGNALGDALEGGIVRGRSLGDVLRGLGARMSEIALSAALKPVETAFGSIFSKITSSALGGASPFSGGGLAAPAPLSGGLSAPAAPEARAAAAPPSAPVTVNIATPDAESFRRSEAQVSAALARAVARGRRGL